MKFTVYTVNDIQRKYRVSRSTAYRIAHKVTKSAYGNRILLSANELKEAGKLARKYRTAPKR